MATKKKDNKKLLKIIIVAAVVVIIGVALVVVLNLPGSEDNKDTQEVTKEAKISDTVDKNKMHQAEPALIRVKLKKTVPVNLLTIFLEKSKLLKLKMITVVSKSRVTLL